MSATPEASTPTAETDNSTWRQTRFCSPFLICSDDVKGEPEGSVVRRIVVNSIVVYTVADHERDAMVTAICLARPRRHHVVRSPSGADQLIIPARHNPGVAARMQRARFTNWRRA